MTAPRNRPPTPVTHTLGFAFVLALGLVSAWIGAFLLVIGVSYAGGGGLAVLGGLMVGGGLLAPMLFWRSKRRGG